MYCVYDMCCSVYGICCLVCQSYTVYIYIYIWDFMVCCIYIYICIGPSDRVKGANWDWALDFSESECTQNVGDNLPVIAKDNCVCIDNNTKYGGSRFN